MRFLLRISPLPLLGCSLLLALPGAARAQGAAPRDTADFSRVMTPAEMDSTGVARLTPRERNALAQWLVRFTTRAVMEGRGNAALPPGHPPVPEAEGLPPGHPPVDQRALPPGHPPVMRPGEAPPSGGEPSPDRDVDRDVDSAAGRDAEPHAEPRAERNAQPRAERHAERGHEADERAGARTGAPRSRRLIATDGAIVTLQDGTRWQVSLPDRPRAAAWQRGDDIVLRAIPAPDGSYATWLIDAQRGDSVSARFAGRAGGNPPRP